jgi:hypothetical protein
VVIQVRYRQMKSSAQDTEDLIACCVVKTHHGGIDEYGGTVEFLAGGNEKKIPVLMQLFYH